MLARLREYGVREDALRAAKLFQQALAPFATSEGGLNSALDGQEGQRRRPAVGESTMYVNSPVDGYCGVCGVDIVEGPGAESCKAQQSCDGFEKPPGFEGLVE